MMPSRSISSANFSGVHLKESFVGYFASSPATANIFSPIQNNRSLPHCTRSVTCGNDRQYLRICSRSISLITKSTKDTRGSLLHQLEHYGSRRFHARSQRRLGHRREERRVKPRQ